MKSAELKDKKHRQLFNSIENNRILKKFLLVSLMNNRFFSDTQKETLSYKIAHKRERLKYKSKTRLIPRCRLTNRSRGTFKSFGLARGVLREFLSFGVVPGYKKAVW